MQRRKKKTKAIEHNSNFLLNDFYAYPNITPTVNSIQGGVYMWGKIGFNKQRGLYYVSGKWQGKRQYYSQCPTHNGLIPCGTRRIAERLQESISIDIENGQFSPEKYKASKPLHLENYIEKWLALKKPELSEATDYDYSNSLNRHVKPVLGDNTYRT